MSYKIIGDSSTDLNHELKEKGNITLVPLTLQIDDEEIVDDEQFDQAYMLERVRNSKGELKSACPSPESFMEHFEEGDDIYVITLSSQLSGSYNSAVLAKNIYLEEHPDKKILIIDSRTASVGQTLLAKQLGEWLDGGMEFEEASERILQYRDELNTKFVLESLEVFRRNGRLSNMKAAICETLNIKAVMTGLPDGTVDKADQARGMKKALEKMAIAIKKDAVNPEERTLGLAHCNNYERALYAKELILKQVQFKDVMIVDTRGISSLYANDGGIIAAY